jgi:hypothetical protein
VTLLLVSPTPQPPSFLEAADKAFHFSAADGLRTRRIEQLYTLQSLQKVPHAIQLIYSMQMYPSISYKFSPRKHVIMRRTNPGENVETYIFYARLRAVEQRAKRSLFVAGRSRDVHWAFIWLIMSGCACTLDDERRMASTEIRFRSNLIRRRFCSRGSPASSRKPTDRRSLPRPCILFTSQSRLGEMLVQPLKPPFRSATRRHTGVSMNTRNRSTVPHARMVWKKYWSEPI